MTDAAPAPAAAEEPSIEEILASIRKIISDEPTPEGEAAAPDAANADVPDMPAPPLKDHNSADEPAPEDDILDLAAFAETPAAPAEPEAPMMENPFETAASAPAPVAAEPAEENSETPFDLGLEDSSNKEIMAADVDISEIMAGAANAASPGEPLVSNPSASAATAAFAKLHRAAEPDHTDTQLWVGSRTIEQVVEDLMRPMLKTWLDQNLPRLVERLVEKELARMSRRASE